MRAFFRCAEEAAAERERGKARYFFMCLFRVVIPFLGFSFPPPDPTRDFSVAIPGSPSFASLAWSFLPGEGFLVARVIRYVLQFEGVFAQVIKFVFRSMMKFVHEGFGPIVFLGLRNPGCGEAETLEPAFSSWIIFKAWLRLTRKDASWLGL